MRVTAILAILAAIFVACPAAAQETVAPKVDAAIAKGLDFLAAQQAPSGAFDEHGPRLAMTSLSVMAYLASGHIPGDGRYGQTVRKGVDFLVKQFPPDGYAGRVDGSRMYGQGIITLGLAEAYGVERDDKRRERMHDVLLKAAKVIMLAQDVRKAPQYDGGWRYEPDSGDSDLSLSGWNAMALRACNNVGISVGSAHISRAAAFVVRCYHPQQKGFAYTPGAEASMAMTGVGVLNLWLMDRGQSPEAQAAAAYLTSHSVEDNPRFEYYTHYYMTRAAFQAGESVWTTTWNRSSSQLLAKQMPDGGWPQSRSGEEPGRIYATAMAVLTLSTPNRLLPVDQR